MYIAGIALYVCLHPGTRYRRRGVNSVGNVANFVETEMVHTYTLYIPVDLIVHVPRLPRFSLGRHALLTVACTAPSDPAGRLSLCVLCAGERLSTCLLDPARIQVPPSTHH